MNILKHILAIVFLYIGLLGFSQSTCNNPTIISAGQFTVDTILGPSIPTPICAQNGTGNLLDFAIDAARQRATLGEISYALEIVFARHTAQVESFKGVYSKEIKDDKNFIDAKKLVEIFNSRKGGLEDGIRISI